MIILVLDSSLGWDGVANGELLRLAAKANFDVLVTVDQGFQYQHNPEQLPIPIVLIKAGRTRLSDLVPLVPSIKALLAGTIYAIDTIAFHFIGSFARSICALCSQAASHHSMR